MIKYNSYSEKKYPGHRNICYICVNLYAILIYSLYLTYYFFTSFMFNRLKKICILLKIL